MFVVLSFFSKSRRPAGLFVEGANEVKASPRDDEPELGSAHSMPTASEESRSASGPAPGAPMTTPPPPPLPPPALPTEASRCGERSKPAERGGENGNGENAEAATASHRNRDQKSENRFTLFEPPGRAVLGQTVRDSTPPSPSATCIGVCHRIKSCIFFLSAQS